MQFTGGDAGGNAWKIAGDSVSNTTNLHSFWDGGAGQWADDVDRPLNATGDAWIEGWVNTITAQYPASSFANKLANTNVWSWAAESNALASSFVYTAAQAPTPLSSAYIAQAKELVRQQVALGGYRLAQLLESVYNPSASGYGVFLKQALAEERAALEAMGARVKVHRLRAANPRN